MVPSNESFDAAHCVGMQIERGLVMQRESAAVDRLAEFVDQLKAIPRVEIVFAVVTHNVELRSFGFIHRHVRTAKQLECGRSMIWRDRSADTGTDPHRDSVDRDRVGECGGQFGCDREKRFHSRDEKGAGEFVATDAGKKASSTDASPKSFAHILQHHVAGVVTDRVVYVLEAVEIDE